LDARLAELEDRLASAELVSPERLSHDEVRFGAQVTVRDGSGEQRVYRIVGVDEADARKGSVAFVSPLARALLGKHAGDSASVRTPQGDQEIEVIAIEYPQP
jgi:transcription elongation GreA/GreB family factor